MVIKAIFNIVMSILGIVHPSTLRLGADLDFFELYFQILVKVQFYKGKLNIYEKVERQQYTT